MNVDVIMVNYHSRRVLPTSVRAARAFIGEGARFIFVDNSPGDGAREVIDEVAPGSTVIENRRNVGFAAGVNRGIAAGSAETVLLLNPDITSISGNVAAVEQAFREDPRVAAVTVQLLDPDGTVQRHIRVQPTLVDLIATSPGLFHRIHRWKRLKRFTLSEWDYQTSREVDIAGGTCLWLRRSALADVGLFDERFFFYWEDTDWLVRAKARGWKTMYLPSIEVVHVSRKSTEAEVESESFDFLLLESQHKYVRKHFGLAGSLVFRSWYIAFDSVRWLRSVFAPTHADRRSGLRKRLSIHLGGSA
jgi:GT2 family glycosyltransferase